MNRFKNWNSLRCGKLKLSRARLESWLQYCLDPWLERVNWCPWISVSSFVKDRYGIRSTDKNTNFAGLSCKIQINEMCLDTRFSQNRYSTSHLLLGPLYWIMPSLWMGWLERPIFQIDFDLKWEKIQFELLKQNNKTKLKEVSLKKSFKRTKKQKQNPGKCASMFYSFNVQS